MSDVEIINSFRQCQGAPAKKRSAKEIRAEIGRVDAAIADLSIDASRGWRVLGSVSVPVALRSLRHYRQRLARIA